MNPFDFVNQIQFGKQDLLTDPQSEKEYVPFVVNRALSYELDCILQANDMNRCSFIDKKLQYHYLLHSIRKRKRPFHKWIKPVTDDLLTSVKTLFECSTPKALEIINTLTQDQLDLIVESTATGGPPKSKKS
jgi:hypothetical protein